ncbi:MAG TPA: AsmA-like C-terminal region-containing protein, partial [Woeseiaceae bacterium]
DLFSNVLDFSEKFDADFRFRAKDSRIYGVNFSQLDIHTLLDHGTLSSKVEKATISDAELSASFNLTPEEGQTTMDFEAALQDASLSALIAGIERLDGVTGKFDGNINLRASGHDGESVLNSTAGRMVLFLEDGEMPDALATRLAGDVFTAIFSDFDKDDTTPIRCAIVEFAVENGVARSERMIMDTGSFNLYGKGEIRLGEQHLNIHLVPRAKDFSLVSMRIPLRFEGPFDSIEFNPNVSKAVASLLTPIELGLEEDASCAPPRMVAVE